MTTDYDVFDVPLREWRDYVTALADALTRSGVLTDPQWRKALIATPRHTFVPRYYTSGHTLLDCHNPAHRQRWLAGAYADRPLAIKLAPNGDGEPVSAASQPTVVIGMLERLDVHDGHNVLEIGTGTGYNAALLCHRLGDSHVTSVDIDPQLVAAAATTLARLGFHPHLVAADGALGVPRAAPFDRIIATCSVTEIPSAWLQQLAVGGRIVTPLLDPERPGALTILDKLDDGTILRRIDDFTVFFMPLHH